MSKKITQDVFIEKLSVIYPENHISIIEWNGYTKPICFLCDICKETHVTKDARQLLEKKTYCQKNAKTNIKWDLVSYNQRINAAHQADVIILEYNGLSNPVKYKCPICGEIKSCNPARALITRLSLCDSCYGVERNLVEKRINTLFNNSNKYKLITWRGSQNKLTEQCLTCNYIFDRYPANVLQCFDTCPNCNSGKDKQKLNLETIQKRIDTIFGPDKYLILDYQGQLNRHNKIKCLTCGLIFETHMVSFLSNSRGCPKCKRFKSKGEQLVQQYLENNNISYEAQKRFDDCNGRLSSFDFCAYDNLHQMYLIEVNGAQHYKENNYFDGLEIIQKRDKIKSDYCMEHNIPLIIIPYTDLSMQKIEHYLSFLKGSTTIPNGSRE